MKDVIIALDFPGREETLRFLGLFGNQGDDACVEDFHDRAFGEAMGDVGVAYGALGDRVEEEQVAVLRHGGFYGLRDPDAEGSCLMGSFHGCVDLPGVS